MFRKSVITALASTVIFFCGCMESRADRTRGKEQPLNKDIKENAPVEAAEEAATDVQVTQPKGEVTLAECVALALKYNPGLKTFSWDLRAAEARKIQAAFSPNPTLTIEAEEFGGSGELSGYDAAETTIMLSQVVESGAKRQKRMRLAEFNNRLSQWDYEVARQDVLMQVAEAFIDVLAAQERNTLIGQMYDSSAKTFESIQKLVEAGRESPVELSKATVSHAKLRTQRDRAVKDLEFARLKLVSLWDSDKAVFEKAVGDFESIQETQSLENVVELIENNPDIARWATEIERRQAALKLEKAKSKENFSFGVGVKHLEESSDHAFVAGVSIPLPIRDSNKGGKMEAIANLSKAADQQAAAVNYVRRQVIGNYHKMTNAQLTIEASQAEILPNAEQTYNASQKGYQEGKFDYLYLLDAQRTFIEMQLQRIDALVTYHKARTQIERLTGKEISEQESEK